MSNFKSKINLIKLASQLENKKYYGMADFLIKLAAGPIDKELGLGRSSDQELMQKDPSNPMAAWLDPDAYAAYQGKFGSGVYRLPDDFMKSASIPNIFKSMTYDEAIKDINAKIGFYDPKIHGSQANFLFKVIPDFAKKPGNLEYFRDAQKLLTTAKEEAAREILNIKYSDDPVIDAKIKENIRNIIRNKEINPVLQSAFDAIN